MTGETRPGAGAAGPTVRRQWLGLLGAPLIWLVHFTVNYALASRACRWMTTLPLHIVSGTALAAIAIIGGIAWLNFEAATDAAGEPAAPVPLSAARIRLMGVVGLMAAILFFLIVVAQWLPTWTADPCQR